LTRGGSALLSFEYEGHGRSDGTFSIKKTLEDAEAVLRWACEHAAKEHLPLHVITTCYSAIPMLSCFRNGSHRFGFRSLSGVASLFDLDQIIKVDRFLLHYFRDDRDGVISTSEFVQRVRSGVIDRDGGMFRNAVKDFLKGLFPELNITRDSFEELQFRRADILETLEQISQMRPLDGIRIPDNIPCLFLYGVRDVLMGLDTPAGRSRYESRVRSIAPHARIHSVDADHYGRGPDHEAIIHELHGFLEKHDRGPGLSKEVPSTHAGARSTMANSQSQAA
jgi:hypothetical protein